MCGIFGYNGKTKPNVSDLKILGLYNESRGPDACGIYINNTLVHGNGPTKRWSSFIEGTNIPEPKTNFSVLAHTRKASSGGQNHEYTHPYSIRKSTDNRKLPDLVGVHNGTLRNWENLLKEYSIEDKNFNDSKALFTILADNSKNYKVLEKFEGAASILMTCPKDNNTLYVFKGGTPAWQSDLPDIDDASRHEEFFGKNFYNEEVDPKSKIKGDRPLYMYVKEEGIYFSSIESSLFAIGGDITNVFPVPVNKLLKFKNGKLVETTKISRAKRGTFHSNYSGNQGNTFNTNELSKKVVHSPRNTPNTNTSKGSSTKSLSLTNDILPIVMVSQLKNYANDVVFYYQGQYFLGGKVIPNGVYPIDVCNGVVTVDSKAGYVKEFGFYDGQLLILPEDVKTLTEMEKKSVITPMVLSEYTIHPMPSSATKVSMIHNGQLSDMVFSSYFGREITLTLDKGAIVNMNINNTVLEETIDEILEDMNQEDEEYNYQACIICDGTSKVTSFEGKEVDCKDCAGTGVIEVDYSVKNSQWDKLKDSSSSTAIEGTVENKMLLKDIAGQINRTMGSYNTELLALTQNTQLYKLSSTLKEIL